MVHDPKTPQCRRDSQTIDMKIWQKIREEIKKRNKIRGALDCRRLPAPAPALLILYRGGTRKEGRGSKEGRLDVDVCILIALRAVEKLFPEKSMDLTEEDFNINFTCRAH